MRDYELTVKPSWWQDEDYYEYHRGKGHKTNDCQKLKNVIQDLVESGEVKINGHTTNDTHTIFKDPLLDHEKGNSSNNKGDNNASYNEVSFKYINNISESHPSQYYANVITFNDEEESKNVNATTRNQAKVIL